MPGRTLDRPPSERYRDRATGGEVAPAGASSGPPTNGTPPPDGAASWLLAVGAVSAATVTALLLVLLDGVLGSTTGTLFVSGIGGALVGLLLAGPRQARRRAGWPAIGLAVAAVVGGALGTWLIARGEGGTLGPVDYLWATSGLLVPAEAVVAGLAAAWGLRAGPITR